MTLKTMLFGAASALVLSAGAANAAPATAETSLNVRSGPGVEYPVVGAIPAGETVDVRGCTGSWCRVAFAGGSGFASRSYLAMASGGPVVAVAPGYAYEDGPYYDDYYDYGYTYGPSVGFYFGGRDHFHHRGNRGWDRGRVGTWSGGGQRWHGGSGNWTGSQGGFAQGGQNFQGSFARSGGGNFHGGNIGGRAAVSAPTGMPSGGGGFRGGGGGFHSGGGAGMGGASVGGGHVGGAVAGGGGPKSGH